MLAAIFSLSSGRDDPSTRTPVFRTQDPNLLAEDWEVISSDPESALTMNELVVPLEQIAQDLDKQDRLSDILDIANISVSSSYTDESSAKHALVNTPEQSTDTRKVESKDLVYFSSSYDAISHTI
jgi:hypothetical protein